jgi:hypothetical protein
MARRHCLSLDYHVSSKRFESFATGLDHRYGDMASFARFDVCHTPGFARMHAADDFAASTVFQAFVRICCCHDDIISF